MRRVVWVFALLFVCAVGVRAQAISLYVTSSSARVSNAQAGLAGQTNPYWSSGIGGGLTLGMVPVGPVRLGLDFRGSTRPGTPGFDTGMGGIRLGINPPLFPIKPYIQASGGYVATRSRAISGTGSFQNRYAAWQVFGGLDYPLVPFFDVRLIEVGGGSGYRVGNTSGTPDISLFTINSGLVFHF